MTHEIEQILGIRAIENAERFVDADARRVLAQHARADAVKRAGPGEHRRAHRCRRAQALQDLSGAPFERLGGAARKRQQQQSLRVGAIRDQVRSPTGKRARLAGARTRNDQQRTPVVRVDAHAMFDGDPLLRVERRQIRRVACR